MLEVIVVAIAVIGDRLSCCLDFYRGVRNVRAIGVFARIKKDSFE